MTDGKGFREYIRGEFAKLRTMSFNEKRLYLWEYYKVHFFGFIIGMVLLFSLLNTLFFNPPPRDYVHIAWLGPHMVGNELRELSLALSEMVVDPERYVVTVENFAMPVGSPINTTMQQRFAVMLQTGMIDLMMINAVGVLDLIEQQLIRPMHELAGNPISVSLYGSPLLARVGIDSEDLHLVVVGNHAPFYRVQKTIDLLMAGVVR